MKSIIHFCKNNFWIILYMSLMTTMLYFRDILDVPIDKNVFVVLVLGFSIFAKYEKLIPIIMFTLPLMCGLPGNFFLPIWCVLIIRHQFHNKAICKSAILFVLLFSLWELVIFLFYPFPLMMMKYIGYVCSLLLLCTLVAEKSNMNHSVSIITFLIGCSILLCCIYLIYVKDPTLMVLDGGRRMGGDAYTEEGVMSLKTNANSIGLISATAISISLTLFYYKKLHIFPFILIIASCFYCGLFAVSRTWVIMVILCFVLYFFFQKENKKVGYAMFFACILGVVYYLRQNDAILQVFMDRFTADNFETGGERTTLFQEYNDFLLNNPFNLLFGTSALLYKEVTGLFHSTHNGLQQVWLSYGIIGFCIFMFAYVSQIKAYYTKGQYMACMPMLITFLFLQTLQVLNPYYGLYPIIASFLVMRMINMESHHKK